MMMGRGLCSWEPSPWQRQHLSAKRTKTFGQDSRHIPDVGQRLVEKEKWQKEGIGWNISASLGLMCLDLSFENANVSAFDTFGIPLSEL